MALDFPQSPQLDEVFVAGDRAWKWNGYAWDKISAGSSTGVYGIIAFIPGTPEPHDILLGHIAALAASFPADLAGSRAYAVIAAAAQVDFTILKNRVQVGALRFTAGQTAGTFLPNPPFALAPGDILEVVATEVTDDTLADIYLTLSGMR